MKKLFCTLLALLLLFSLSACDTGRGGEETSGSTEPAETSGETPGETLVQIADTEVPWYIEAWVPNPYTLPEESTALAVKCPCGDMGEANDISFSIDFFQEYYLVNSPIQVRLTLTNQGENSILFHANGLAVAYFSVQDAVLSTPNAILEYDSRYFPSQHEKEHYTSGYYDIESVERIEIPAGETLVLEYLFIGTQGFFSQAEDYLFVVDLRDGENSLARFEIPIEIVEVDVAEAE